jgi:hypothetical protein
VGGDSEGEVELGFLMLLHIYTTVPDNNSNK